MEKIVKFIKFLFTGGKSTPNWLVWILCIGYFVGAVRITVIDLNSYHKGGWSLYGKYLHKVKGEPAFKINSPAPRQISLEGYFDLNIERIKRNNQRAKEINKEAEKLLKKGVFAETCSCHDCGHCEI